MQMTRLATAGAACTMLRVNQGGGMLDRLIDVEIRFLCFANDRTNILVTVIGTIFIMFSLYQLPEKEWLVFIVGLFIIWQRVLLLKIKKLQSSTTPGQRIEERK